MNESMKWIDSVRGTDSLREVARRIHTTHSTLARQVNADAVTFETVRDVSRAYRRSVLSDLILLGHLTTADAGLEGVERALQAATDAELVREVARRMDGGAASMYWDSPISEAVDRAENVARLDDHRRPPVDDERAVASEFDGDYDEDDGYDA